MSDIQAIAPTYMYYVADLLSNQILAEIPFGGVSYERALKGAGSFSGNIPINDQTNHIGVYENTMPGKTALYVVRDGVCVWGGIIWARSYSVVNRVLDISASEFTSYFYHRRIWKTWSQEYGCTLVVAGNMATVTLDDGATSAFQDGSSVKLEFYDVANIRYDGYYKVAATPAPTTSKFYLEGPYSSATITAVERTDGTVTVTTDTKHGFSTGDVINVSIDGQPTLSGSFKITSIGGSTANLFSYEKAGANLDSVSATGTSIRPIPDGVYKSTTVIVRTDTYDYVRSLIDAVSSDFVGTDFPNVYIEPGITTGFDVSNKMLDGGFATLETAEAHNVAIGQAIQVTDVSPMFDGEYIVTATPDDTTVVYLKDGTLESTPVSERKAEIDWISASNNIAYVYTTTAHGFLVGQRVTMDTEYTLGGFESAFNGVYEIVSIPTTTSFTYKISTAGKLPAVYFANPRITVGGQSTEVARAELVGQTVTLTTANPHNLTSASLPATVSVADVNRVLPIIQKSYDAANGYGTITTSEPHGLTINDTASVLGLSDSVELISKRIVGLSASKVVDITTAKPHNFSTGSVVTIENMTDDYEVVSKSVASNVMTIGTSTNHNISVGGEVTVAGVGDLYEVGSVQLTDDVATVYIVNSSGVAVTGHNIRVNDSISITSIRDRASTQSKELIDGVAYVTMLDPHNFTVNSDIIVTGMGAPFDGSFKILDVTDTRVVYETVRTTDVRNAEIVYNYELSKAIERGVRAPYSDPAVSNAYKNLLEVKGTKGSIPPTIALAGVVEGRGSVFNGKYTVSAVTASTVKFNRPANDVRKTTLPKYSTTVSKRKCTASDVTLTVSDASKFNTGDTIRVTGIGPSYNGTFQITGVSNSDTTDTITYKKVAGLLENEVASGGTVAIVYELSSDDSVYNGTFKVSSATSDSLSYKKESVVVSRAASLTTCSLVLDLTQRYEIGDSIVVAGVGSRYNGTVTVKTVNVGNNVTITYDKAGTVESSTSSSGTATLVLINASSTIVPNAVADGDIQATASTTSVNNGTHVVTAYTRDTFRFNQTVGTTVLYMKCSGTASAPSVFNGVNLDILTVTEDEFEYVSPVRPRNNVLETPTNQVAYAIASQLFNGTYAITSVDPDNNKITYNLAANHNLDIAEFAIPGKGHATVKPVIEVSTFGPYPGNADIGIEFSTREYSGVDVLPQSYRGYEITNVGDALSQYADNIDGFEYRIDCVYDANTDKFRKIFQLIPINFPAPPLPGEVSPISRFGADKLVFEYPGNISDVSIEESAENSATRFFAVGQNDLGPNAGPPFAVAASTDLLDGSTGRKWPLLDDDEAIKDISDETVLYAYASKYLTESRPPDARLTVNVNGSLEPVVGSYAPGDWCSLIVEDRFIQARLASDLEPRDTVIVRKIDSIRVNVPDGTTFPEKVDLVLIPEWEVDKRG
jgi:hypothetical protein